jgi:hypothetical protein
MKNSYNFFWGGIHILGQWPLSYASAIIECLAFRAISGLFGKGTESACTLVLNLLIIPASLVTLENARGITL